MSICYEKVQWVGQEEALLNSLPTKVLQIFYGGEDLSSPPCVHYVFYIYIRESCCLSVCHADNLTGSTDIDASTT